jgi:hypothetical protein
MHALYDTLKHLSLFLYFPLFPLSLSCLSVGMRRVLCLCLTLFLAAAIAADSTAPTSLRADRALSPALVSKHASIFSPLLYLSLILSLSLSRLDGIDGYRPPSAMLARA